METIHATPHYNVLQPPDGSFLIVPRDKKTRRVLRDILAELEFNTTTEPIRDDGSYRIQGNHPFGLVRVIERCEARMALAEVEDLLGSGERAAG
ncbi:MAG: hypothetical protein F4018_07630 [Acidobacteria bacterium]|nr:hypothetical protein [Acidobacteriota bacterium]MYH29309.1 hypothetical protein [Acidobacteriota bacterium]MYK88214.1 hypothetical protein [Acidobacteriota bacterium]